jgi:hypothetical protein
VREIGDRAVRHRRDPERGTHGPRAPHAELTAAAACAQVPFPCLALASSVVFAHPVTIFRIDLPHLRVREVCKVRRTIFAHDRRVHEVAEGDPHGGQAGRYECVALQSAEMSKRARAQYIGDPAR